MVNPRTKHPGRQKHIWQRIHLNQYQATALDLHDQGLNVIPQPLGKKHGFPWKTTQYVRLSRDDSRYGLPIVFAGKCNLAVITGWTSENLFVLDCETEDAYHKQIQHLRERNIPLYTNKSANGGHIHLRCREGEVDNIALSTLKDMEVRGHSNYVLVPPSVHPTGAIYTVDHREHSEPPVVSLHDIDWLSLKLNRRQSSDGTHYTNLSRRTQNYVNGQYESNAYPNDILFAAACDYAGNGYTQDEAMRDLSRTAHLSGLPDKEIERNLRNAYSKSRHPSRETRSGSGMNQAKRQQMFEGLRAFLHQQEWAGRTGSTDAAVFRACIARAEQWMSPNASFRAAQREVAELAHKSRAAVDRAFKRLTSGDNALLVYVGSDTRSGASLYQFSDWVLQEVERYYTAGQTVPDIFKVSNRQRQRSDLFEQAGISHNGEMVYNQLCMAGTSLSGPKIAARLGLSVHQVRTALRKLRDFGLVKHLGHRTGYVAIERSHDDLTKSIRKKRPHLHGKSGRRIRRHQKDRATYAAKRLIIHRQREDPNLPPYFRDWIVTE